MELIYDIRRVRPPIEICNELKFLLTYVFQFERDILRGFGKLEKFACFKPSNKVIIYLFYP